MTISYDELAALFAAWREDIDSEPFNTVFVPRPRDGADSSTFPSDAG